MWELLKKIVTSCDSSGCTEEENPGLMLYRFFRVVFGVNASPFLLNATLKYHISQYEADPGLVQNLLNSFYVDDLVTGERGVEECVSLYQKSKKCLLEGGFNLLKWISNSPKLLELICEDQVGTVGTCAESLMRKLLSIIWRSLI